MRSPSSVPDLSTTEALLRLLAAALLGGAIGFERELRDHEAGFRTHLIVSLGAWASGNRGRRKRRRLADLDEAQPATVTAPAPGPGSGSTAG